MATISLGDEVRDTVTGYTGTVTARSEYLQGTTRCAVESYRDGKMTCEWIDEGRLAIVS